LSNQSKKKLESSNKFPFSKVKKEKKSQASQSQQESLNKSQKFPPFPPGPNQREKEESFPLTGEEEGLEEISADPFIIEVCKDLLEAGCDLWRIIARYPIEELSEKAKERCSRPLARMAVKYGFAKITKDEVLFLMFLGIEITKRLPKKQKPKEEKDVDDRRRKEGLRQDDLNAKSNSQQ